MRNIYQRFFILITIILTTLFVVPHSKVYAQEITSDTSTVSTTSSSQAPSSDFVEDLKQARDILTKNTTSRPFLRGMLMPLFQPVFMVIMFCFGLWTGQESGKLSTIWAVPIVLFVSIVAAAFISAFHPQWQPDLTFASTPYLPDMTTNGVIGVVLSMVVGAMVGMQFTLPAYIALVFAALAGLGLGFTHTINDIGETSLVSFWLGFGLSGLIFNIIGIGFETFLESINLSVMVRLVGFICVCLGFVLAVNVF